MKPRKLIIKSDHALVPLSQKRFAIIDLKDVERVQEYNWCAHRTSIFRTFYAMGWVNGKKVKLHRFILDITDPKIQVDHCDRNGLENRQFNIRVCTPSQNNMNSRPRNSSSQYKGVSWNKCLCKWRAWIGYDNKQIYLGYHNDEKLAAQSYNEIARVLFGEFARLNKI